MNFGLLKDRNFILYSLGQSISNLGSLITTYALSLYVLDYTKSSILFAFILSAKYIPQIFLYPFSGVIVDKTDRKKILIFFDGLRGFFLFVLLILIQLKGTIHLSLVYGIMLVAAIAETFYNPATNAIIPMLFEEKDYIMANSFTSWIQNLSLLLGPILGAAIYSVFGIHFVLACDGISFFIVMIFTAFLRFNKKKVPDCEKTSIIQEMQQGVSLLFKNRDLALAVLGIGFSRFFINPFYTLGLPIIIIKILKSPLYALSFPQSSMMAGTLLSPIVVIFFARKFTDPTSLMISRMGKMIPFTILLLIGFNDFSSYLNQHIQLLVLYFSCICFLAAMFNSSGFVFLNSYFQKRIPREYLGRFASIRFMFYSIVEPLGLNFFGLLYGKVKLGYPLFLVLLGAVLEAILLSGVCREEKVGQIEI